MLPLGTPISLLLGRLVSSWRTGNKVPHTTTSATDLVSWAREAESGLEAASTQAQGSASGQAAASSALQGEGPTQEAVLPPPHSPTHPSEVGSASPGQVLLYVGQQLPQDLHCLQPLPAVHQLSVQGR